MIGINVLLCLAWSLHCCAGGACELSVLPAPDASLVTRRYRPILAAVTPNVSALWPRIKKLPSLDSGPVEMVEIPSGKFIMGCNSSVDTFCNGDELPARSILIGRYLIDREEVTFDSFRQCVQAGVCEPFPKTSQCDASTMASAAPMACATWTDAATYCAWRGKRLPTEAEWELAARGRQASIYPWGNAPICTDERTQGSVPPHAECVVPVGKDVSVWGVRRMATGVREWVADWYASDITRMPRANPDGPQAGQYKVVRGGMNTFSLREARASFRSWRSVDVRDPSVGFRCAQ